MGEPMMLWHCTELGDEMKIKTCVALTQWSVAKSSKSVIWATAIWWIGSEA